LALHCSSPIFTPWRAYPCFPVSFLITSLTTVLQRAFSVVVPKYKWVSKSRISFVHMAWGAGRVNQPYHQHQPEPCRMPLSGHEMYVQHHPWLHRSSRLLLATLPQVSAWSLTCPTLTTSRPLLYSLPLAQPMTSAPSFTSLSTNWYTIIWMTHLSLQTVVNNVDTGLVSVKPLVTLWPSRFLLTTQRRSFTAPKFILLVTCLVGTYGGGPH
jgi:hypothetical protein